MDGKSLPELHDSSYQFVPGAIDVLREGDEIALVAMGSTVHEAVDAAAQLNEQGVSAKVISVPSVRPLDRDAFLRTLNGIEHIITVEEHNVNGGVGSITAEILADNGHSALLKRLGIPDGEYAIAADRKDMRMHHGFDAASIVHHALGLLNR
ncbi:transketolase C-terminal domain-containing protein [Pantoea sp. LMR881]|uniref:transketolase C-terminal domain-containing protein n=1 Tax=Pantoea sp. LMR881 TaxID=3014336 RepID=UPI003FA7ABC3